MVTKKFIIEPTGDRYFSSIPIRYESDFGNFVLIKSIFEIK